MTLAVERLVIYIDAKKKRKLNAVLATKGQSGTEFFNNLIDDLIRDEKKSVIDLFKRLPQKRQT